MQRIPACFLLLILLSLACSVPAAVPTSGGSPAEPTPSLTLQPSPRPAEYQVCSGVRMLAMLVNPSLEQAVRAGLDIFENDLCAAGYAVIERRSTFATPVDLRNYLAVLYAQSAETLAGAILIGDFPHAYQYLVMTYANPDIPASVEEVISFQFYTDLDGTFRASEGYASPGGHPFSYDIHEGELDWEIWVSLLPAYKGDPLQTAEAINRFFAKDHAYRSAGSDIPQAFLEINEHARPESAAEDAFYLREMISGQYSWTPLSSAGDARLYFDSFSGERSTDQGYLELAGGAADIAILEAHGYALASGKIDIDWIRTNGLRTVLLWSDGCSVGNLDYPETFLTSALYDPRSQVLVAKGTTNDSGGLGTNSSGFFGHNIAVGILDGQSLGDALLGHVNTPLIYPWSNSRELHFATLILLGDPTLELRP